MANRHAMTWWQLAVMFLSAALTAADALTAVVVAVYLLASSWPQDSVAMAGVGAATLAVYALYVTASATVLARHGRRGPVLLLQLLSCGALHDACRTACGRGKHRVRVRLIPAGRWPAFGLAAVARLRIMEGLMVAMPLCVLQGYAVLAFPVSGQVARPPWLLLVSLLLSITSAITAWVTWDCTAVSTNARQAQPVPRMVRLPPVVHRTPR